MDKGLAVRRLYLWAAKTIPRIFLFPKDMTLKCYYRKVIYVMERLRVQGYEADQEQDCLTD